MSREGTVRPLSRNAKVLRYLIEQAPDIGRIQLIKFAYLADHEARRYLGHPITQFKWIRYKHGPFDPSYYDALKELTGAGLVREAVIDFPNGAHGYRFAAMGKELDYGFSDEEAALLAYVAETYVVWGARELCDDVVYQTSPMKADVAMNKELPMDQLDNAEHKELGFDLSRMLAGERSVHEGRYRPLTDVIHELQARHHA